MLGTEFVKKVNNVKIRGFVVGKVTESTVKSSTKYRVTYDNNKNEFLTPTKLNKLLANQVPNEVTIPIQSPRSITARSPEVNTSSIFSPVTAPSSTTSQLTSLGTTPTSSNTSNSSSSPTTSPIISLPSNSTKDVPLSLPHTVKFPSIVKCPHPTDTKVLGKKRRRLKPNPIWAPTNTPLSKLFKE